MKKINIILLALIALIFSSCEKEKTSEGLASVTNYPIITVDGDNPIFLPKGTAFEDPGVVATEDGNEIGRKVGVNPKQTYLNMYGSNV